MKNKKSNRERNIAITIRLTEKEKHRIVSNAKKCKLSVSEFLRQLANGYVPKPIPTDEFERFNEQLRDIYLDFCEYGTQEEKTKILNFISFLQQKFITAERRKLDGNNLSMGS